MHTLAAALVIIAASMFASGQSPADRQVPPNVQVLGQSWSKDTYRWGWDKYPLTDKVSPGSTDPREISGSSRPWITRYIYRMKVRNDGPKQIKAVCWDYVFSDLLTGQEVGRHRFRSVGKIGCGKERTVSVVYKLPPPVKVVSVKALEKDADRPFTERVEIQYVAFSDGTSWRSVEFAGSCP